MPFGLTNAPPGYSRLINLVLHGVGPEIALVFLDDVIIHSRDFTGHLRNLETVLKAYRKAGLKLKPSKCSLFQKQVEYLGHLVSEGGVEAVPKYIKIVREWREPRNFVQFSAMCLITAS